MKISTHHRKQDKVLKECITFSLENSNKFTLEFEKSIVHFSINFDLKNPQSSEQLFDKVLKVKVEGRDIEFIELHCNKENKSHLWLLTTNEGESLLIFAEKHYCELYRENAENGYTTHYYDVINVTITLYENEKG